MHLAARSAGRFAACFAGRSLAAALVATAIIGLTATTALAHGHRHVGDFNFTVGFFVEPAFEGEKNGVDLRVERGEEPVEGVHETLSVEIIHEANSIELPLRAVFGQPGRYTADFFPTATGDFTFRFHGTIDGTEIDESFTSTEDSFSVVRPAAELQFPVAVVSGRELQAGITGATDAATTAQDAVSATETRANIALAVGALGLLIGVGGIAMSMRRRA